MKEYDKSNTSILTPRTVILIINRDGTFERNIPDMYQTKGKWELNSDSSKLKFLDLERHGYGMVPTPLVTPTDSIIKLTKDTLIYCSSSFRTRQKIPVNIDYCYVREK